MIISCTFRHSEQHIKSWTELKYGKLKTLTLKKMAHICPRFYFTLLKEKPNIPVQ